MSLVSNVDQNETSQKFCSEQSPIHPGDTTCESFPVNYNRIEEYQCWFLFLYTTHIELLQFCYWTKVIKEKNNNINGLDCDTLGGCKIDWGRVSGPKALSLNPGGVLCVSCHLCFLVLNYICNICEKWCSMINTRDDQLRQKQIIILGNLESRYSSSVFVSLGGKMSIRHCTLRWKGLKFPPNVFHTSLVPQ